MRARLVWVGLLVSCAGPQRPGGGSWVGAAVPVPATREALLDRAADGIARGDLVVAGDALTTLADRERKRRDTALDFWSELLALERCEPLTRAPRIAAGDPALADPWERLRRLVQIERVRLGRNAEPPKEPPTMLTPARPAASWSSVAPRTPRRWRATSRSTPAILRSRWSRPRSARSPPTIRRPLRWPWRRRCWTWRTRARPGP